MQKKKATTKAAARTKPIANDNAAEVQRGKILALLRTAARHTFELRAFGIAMPATRIFELKKLGHDIRCARISAVDSDGFLHYGVALYELASEGGQA
jgi:hypothetical protein